MLVTQHDLPANYSREIGRIMVKWAYLETYVQHCVYMLVGIDDLGGRLVIREPRLTNRIDMLMELAHIRGFPLNEDPLKKTKQWIEETNRWRDLFAHSTWVEIPEKGWHIRDIKGNLPQMPEYRGHDRKRKINPEAKEITIDFLRSVTDRIELLISNARAMQEALQEMLEEQREQFLEQIQEDNPEDHPHTKTPPDE